MTEKGLAEKIMYCIYIDSQTEVEKYFADYIKHTELLGKKRNIDLLSKTCSAYTNYQIKKHREEELRKCNQE